ERPGLERGAATFEERDHARDRSCRAHLARDATAIVERERDAERGGRESVRRERAHEAVERGAHEEEHGLHGGCAAREFVDDRARIVAARERGTTRVVAAGESPGAESVAAPATLDFERI